MSAVTEISAIDRQSWPQDAHILGELAQKLMASGTGLSHGLYHQRCKGFIWYEREQNRRDWRNVAYRWLRRFVGGEWHVGGHHVGRLHYGPAIGDTDGKGRREELAEVVTHIVVDGKPAYLELIR